MKYLKLAENKINQTINSLIEKNKQYAQNNRNKLVIKNHNNTIKDCYEKIGKYYYNSMRSKDNKYLEELCKKIDQSSKIIETFKNKLIIDNNIKNHELKTNELNDENDNKVIINSNPTNDTKSSDKPSIELPSDTPIDNAPNITIIEDTFDPPEENREILNTQKKPRKHKTTKTQENIKIQYPEQFLKEFEQDNDEDINNLNQRNIDGEDSNFNTNQDNENISLF